jgi:hypothetical protein
MRRTDVPHDIYTHEHKKIHTSVGRSKEYRETVGEDARRYKWVEHDHSPTRSEGRDGIDGQVLQPA